ncbi:MAG TPA: TniQ family protein [Pyrinomonadaceae bacterium]
MRSRANSNGLSGKLWPAHTKPKGDELLSSWLVRLAMSHALKLHTFCSLAWSRRKQIWNRDIDKCADKAFLSVLAEKTATSFASVVHTTLSDYEGRLYEKHNPYGNTPWIMPVGVYHRTRTRYGLQFCPRCLAEDKEPYYRRSWRLAFVIFCEQHNVPLFDRCQQCGSPVNFHRNELGDRRKLLAESITVCHACRSDLKDTPVSMVESLADRRVLEFQRSLTRMMGRGWTRVKGYGVVYSHFYFIVLHQLMKVCATGKRAMSLREAVSRELNIERPLPTLTTSAHGIEHLNIMDRRKLLDMARYLLDDWPQRFIRLCLTHKVWSAALLRDMAEPPFWYWSIIHDHLYRISYTPSNQEILSAITHLNRTGETLCQKNISRCLGKGDVFRKRKDKSPLLSAMGRHPTVQRISP